MLIPIIGTLSFIVGVLGFYRAFQNKSMIIFIWIIVTYYSVTSLIAMYSTQNSLIHYSTKVNYVVNYFFCTLGFYFCDRLFNRRIREEVDLDFLTGNKLFHIIECVYWISFVFTFIELRGQDYATYNTGNGAGWAQIFFMLSSGIVFYFTLNKQWVKIIISTIMMVLIIVALGVRSMLYFILMPFAFYCLYNLLFSVDDIGAFIKKSILFVILVLLASFLVGYIRFGDYSLPETELTDIALDSMQGWTFGNQGINSFLHYISGFFNPVRNTLNMIDVHVPDFAIVPSVPRLNAMMRAGVSDVSMLQNAYHMPATLFYDLYVCWGNYAGFFAFLVYWYFIKIFDLFQNGAFRMLLFSSLVGWHFYMLMRGAPDGASSAMGYPLLLGFVIFFIVKTMNLLRGKKGFKIY